MRLGSLLAAAVLLAAPAWACSGRSAVAQTVADVTARGSIDIGVLTDLPPYGVLNDRQEPDGYDVDVAKLLAKYLGVKLNLVPLTGPNRMPALIDKKVDLIVATLGITPERAKTALFSIPYGFIENVVFAPKASPITSIDDLKGKRVGVPRDTVQDVLLSATLGNAASITRYEDDPSTYRALLSGQVDAIAESGLTGDQIYAATPNAGIERKFLLLRQPSGIGMRLDQWNLRQWVNTFIFYIENDGELNVLHEKWFHEPLPPLPAF
jgi:polar amino acid transport system substrate-binding protein